MSKRCRKNWEQLSLDQARKPTGRGGWRPGAGRPKGRHTTPHDKRPEIVARFPLHVTWRAGANAPNLRGYYASAFIRGAIKAVNGEGFRVVEYSIQSNHIHMLLEAESKKALERGMRRLARRIIGKMKTKFAWKGQLLTRYHARPLKTPREVRNALRCVLLNARHHAADRGERIDPRWIDPYSSGYWFDGWKQPVIVTSRFGLELERLSREPRPTATARTWLLAVGWRRWGLLRVDEVPGQA